MCADFTMSGLEDSGARGTILRGAEIAALVVVVALFASLALQTFNSRCIAIGVPGAVLPPVWLVLAGARVTQQHILVDAIGLSFLGLVRCSTAQQ